MAISEMRLEVPLCLETALVFLAKAALPEGRLVLQALADCSGPLVLDQCKLCLL